MRWIDYFVGNRYQDDADLLYKVRLLVACLLSCLASVVGFMPFYSFIPGLSDSAVNAYYFIAFPAAALWAWLIYLLKQSKAYLLSSHIAVASIAAVLFAGVAVTGGPASTEVHPLLVMPMVIAFLLVGHKSGFVWTSVICVIYFAMLAVGLSGYEYINLPPESARSMLKAFNWSYSFIMVAALIFVYELINRKVTAERDAERDKFKRVANLAVNSEVVNKSADALTESGEFLLESAMQQKVAIEQLVTTTEELNATASQNSHLASDAKSAIQQAEEQVLKSKQEMDELASTMTGVKHSSEEILQINNVVNEIAYQTNLLSLNAMIEASRAGEGNGGFKVVAMEVKKLAERSAAAVDDISKLVNENLQSVAKGVALSSSMQERLEDIAERIVPVTTSVQNVADASHEQNSAVRQIVAGLADIDSVIEEHKRLSVTAAETARDLQLNTGALMEAVDDLGIDLSTDDDNQR